MSSGGMGELKVYPPTYILQVPVRLGNETPIGCQEKLWNLVFFFPENNYKSHISKFLTKLMYDLGLLRFGVTICINSFRNYYYFSTFKTYQTLKIKIQ